MPSTRNTAVSAVRAIYAIDEPDERAWLGRVLEKVRSCVAGATGGFAYTYDIGGPPEGWTIAHPIVDLAPPKLADHIFAAFRGASADERRGLLPRLGPSGTFSAVTGQTLAVFGAREASRWSMHDAVHVNALDADDRGVLVSLTIPSPRTLAPLERRRYAMLAAHLAAARRLREAARAAPELTFDARGRLVHAAPGHERTTPRLREHVSAWVRHNAGGERGTRGDAVLASWSALVDGRYSLVDRFESDGRHFLVAHENPPNVRDPRGLTKAEAAVAAFVRRGHPLKLVAYELGLSIGTVSGLLARVFAKLGVRTRGELSARLEEAESVTEIALGGAQVVVFAKGPELLHFPESVGLSPAERDVCARAARGEGNAAIAAARSSTVRTVTNQLTAAFRKLGVGSRAELAALLRRPS
jgi:DNA-binding CsgD family transcriptional regulator